MPVEGFDHVAITVADVEATLRWYERVLGATPMLLEQFLAGELPIAMLQVGASRMSVHPAAKPAAPHAEAPTAGSADLCFRYAGSVDEILAGRGTGPSTTGTSFAASPARISSTGPA